MKNGTYRALAMGALAGLVACSPFEIHSEDLRQSMDKLGEDMVRTSMSFDPIKIGKLFDAYVAAQEKVTAMQGPSSSAFMTMLSLSSPPAPGAMYRIAKVQTKGNPHYHIYFSDSADITWSDRPGLMKTSDHVFVSGRLLGFIDITRERWRMSLGDTKSAFLHIAAAGPDESKDVNNEVVILQNARGTWVPVASRGMTPDSSPSGKLAIGDSNDWAYESLPIKLTFLPDDLTSPK